MIGDGGHAAVIKTFRPDANVIAIGNNATRKRVALEHEGMRPVHIWDRAIHPSAIIAPDVPIGAGTVIMAGAIVQTGARIGKHCIINTGATVDHDCVLEDYVHVAPGAHLCGNVHVGEGTLVGVGVGIAPNTTISAWSLVKARRLEICPMK